MKIKKISEIKNFSIFKDFDWDTNLTYQNKQRQNEVYDFKDINILYGRNYSGKTSLSKIIRSLEKKQLPLKYDNPDFKIKLSDDTEITQNTLQTFEHPIHVYNSDFVKENLKFIHNENDNIESFSVTLGGDNQQILEQIQKLKGELGSNEENNKSGIYLDIHNKEHQVRKASENHNAKNRHLENTLSDKATRGSESIKSQHTLFGDINYSITKLRNDLTEVQKSSFQVLSEDQKIEKLALIKQTELPTPPEIPKYTLNFSSLLQATTETLKTVVSLSGKIEELTNNPTLNSWVQTGHQLHHDRDTCAFCNNKISEEREQTLNQHFNQEFQILQSRISKGIQLLDKELDSEILKFNLNINLYYQQYHSRLSALSSNLDSSFSKQKASLEQLKIALEQKQNNPFIELESNNPQDYSLEITTILDQISDIRNQCIRLNSDLKTKQEEAKKAVRLNHVYHFLQDINHTQLTSDIEFALQAIAPLKTELATLRTRKDTLLSDIETEEAKLKSEGEACNRIKELLNHEFGHSSLSLEPIEVDTMNGKQIKFEIQRIKDGNKTKAHNLSEGECSLISFCYFLAKIQDDLDHDKKPIIWIDDPICSLDNNHIYLIYSLLENLCLENNYNQLFISTHNLDFLKYLTQLTPMGKTATTIKREKAFYQIERAFTCSILKKMPLHLQENSSEFIYLFDQIYKCSLAIDVDDSNHIYFYNFANNARKFLEIYTYYLFPNPQLKDRQRLQRFWGDRLPRIFSERINHDGSHAVTILEGKITLRDFSEVNTNAKLILSKLKTSNSEQYNCLLESIGITPTTQ
ncbi:AAA family ATPase [Acinetobacter equi]|uniref:Protein CR006 P-loop domain-containing protein n=1 Tax=Acinetobacter equi TaxID=1324350 RepID=A0A0N9W0W5_9GAMM|nr:AAA family ATPase [Acinetobacter equi]ALH94655.1 hypothetical protein AOY20_03405 [Acinetobacter equi]